MTVWTLVSDAALYHSRLNDVCPAEGPRGSRPRPHGFRAVGYVQFAPLSTDASPSSLVSERRMTTRKMRSRRRRMRRWIVRTTRGRSERGRRRAAAAGRGIWWEELEEQEQQQEGEEGEEKGEKGGRSKRGGEQDAMSCNARATGHYRAEAHMQCHAEQCSATRKNAEPHIRGRRTYLAFNNPRFQRGTGQYQVARGGRGRDRVRQEIIDMTADLT